MTDEKRITTEARGHVLLIGLHRPAKINAFDPADAPASSRRPIRELEKGPHRCAVLFAHGEHFTAGLDLAKVAPVVMQGKGLFPSESQIDPFGLHGPARTKPVVCAVHGRCLTLGIELVLASDITIAADDTKFAQIEVKRGIFPFGGATLRWVQASGWGNAMRWLLTGDELGAEEALRIGLVQEIAPRGAHLEKAIAIAETIAAQAPLGVQATLALGAQSTRKGLRERGEGARPADPGADADRRRARRHDVVRREAHGEVRGEVAAGLRRDDRHVSHRRSARQHRHAPPAHTAPSATRRPSPSSPTRAPRPPPRDRRRTMRSSRAPPGGQSPSRT